MLVGGLQLANLLLFPTFLSPLLLVLPSSAFKQLVLLFPLPLSHYNRGLVNAVESDKPCPRPFPQGLSLYNGETCKFRSSLQRPDQLLETGVVSDCSEDLAFGCVENNRVLKEHTVFGVTGVITPALINSGFVRVPGSFLPTHDGAPWVASFSCVVEKDGNIKNIVRWERGVGSIPFEYPRTRIFRNFRRKGIHRSTRRISLQTGVAKEGIQATKQKRIKTARNMLRNEGAEKAGVFGPVNQARQEPALEEEMAGELNPIR